MDEAARKDAGASQVIFKARLEIVSEIQSLATAPKMCVSGGEFHVQCFYRKEAIYTTLIIVHVLLFNNTCIAILSDIHSTVTHRHTIG